MKEWAIRGILMVLIGIAALYFGQAGENDVSGGNQLPSIVIVIGGILIIAGFVAIYRAGKTPSK